MLNLDGLLMRIMFADVMVRLLPKSSNPLILKNPFVLKES